HIKKDYTELRTLMELRQLQKEQKKSLIETNKHNQKMQAENISYSSNNLYITNIITEQEGPSTKVLESNNLKNDNSIDIINEQEATFEENLSNTKVEQKMPKQAFLPTN
ncbi:812_t:CDS:1, partial [Cetraspora pellucida]